MPKKPTEVQETPVSSAAIPLLSPDLDASLANWLSKDAILVWQAGCTLNSLTPVSASEPLSSASMPQHASTHAPKCMLRCWGAAFNLPLLQQLLDLLAAAVPGISAQLALHQPHPALCGAVSLGLSATLPPALISTLRQWAQTHDIELNVLTQPVLLSAPGVLVMDMDSTAITIECIDEIAKLAGVGGQVAAVTARAMNGELDFAQSLRQRVATLKDAPDSILKQVLDAVPLMPGLETLVACLQQHQWQVVIASGGFTYFTEALKQRLKLTATFANQLEIIDGKLTGQVLGAVVDAQTKAEVVQQIARQYQIPPRQTVAIGDGANDLPMLAEAALGVAFHAKAKVQAQAKAAIRQGSLLQLLYLLDN